MGRGLQIFQTAGSSFDYFTVPSGTQKILGGSHPRVQTAKSRDQSMSYVSSDGNIRSTIYNLIQGRISYLQGRISFLQSLISSNYFSTLISYLIPDLQNLQKIIQDLQKIKQNLYNYTPQQLQQLQLYIQQLQLYIQHLIQMYKMMPHPPQ
jgi:hypothetical protein